MNKKRSIYSNNDDNLFIKRYRKDNYDENNKYYDVDDYKYDDTIFNLMIYHILF
jgi:hypothetical protein